MNALSGHGDRTALHLAVSNGRTGAVEALLAAGARLDAVNAWPKTPEHYAPVGSPIRDLLREAAGR